MNVEFHPLSELDARMKPETLAKARKIYERDLMGIRLKEMREKHGGPEGEAAAAVPKLERRKDIGVAALIDYVENFGMGLEIVAVPKKAGARRQVLLRV